MPCNAVATARAQVSQESLAKLLTDELISNVVYSYLKVKYPNLQPREESDLSGVDFIMVGYRVHIQNGAVTVTGGWTGDRDADNAKCKLVANDITAFLAKTAGILFQRNARQAIASRYAIGEEQRAPNGALVLSVEL